MIVRNILAMVVFLILTASASAQSSFPGRSQPNAFGGMNYYSPSGASGSSQPNAFGGSSYSNNGR